MQNMQTYRIHDDDLNSLGWTVTPDIPDIAITPNIGDACRGLHLVQALHNQGIPSACLRIHYCNGSTIFPHDTRDPDASFASLCDQLIRSTDPKTINSETGEINPDMVFQNAFRYTLEAQTTELNACEYTVNAPHTVRNRPSRAAFPI